MSAVQQENLLQFPVDKTHIFDVPQEYLELQKHEPFAKVQLKLDGSVAWLLTRYKDVREVLSHPDVSAKPSSPGYPHITEGHKVTSSRPGDFVYLDDPEHDHFRGLLTRDFLVKGLHAMRPDVEWIVDQLTDNILEQVPPVDLVKEFSMPLPSMVICKLLGVPYEEHELFQKVTGMRLNINNSAEETAKAVEELINTLDEVVTEKEQNPTDDVLSRLVANIETGAVTHEEVVNISRLLVSAGHDTTAGLISLSTALLLQHPDQFRMLLEDESLIPKGIEEILRYTTVIHTTPRRAALKDIEINGHLIKAGEGIIPLTAAANRDPEMFPDPNKFDITRGSRDHLAFNYGPHYCLGANLARMELDIVMKRFYPRLPDLALAVPFDEVNFKMDSLMLGAYEMPITWKS